jgi:hypothetical protein
VRHGGRRRGNLNAVTRRRREALRGGNGGGGRERRRAADPGRPSERAAGSLKGPAATQRRQLRKPNPGPAQLPLYRQQSVRRCPTRAAAAAAPALSEGRRPGDQTSPGGALGPGGTTRPPLSSVRRSRGAASGPASSHVVRPPRQGCGRRLSRRYSQRQRRQGWGQALAVAATSRSG